MLTASAVDASMLQGASVPATCACALCLGLSAPNGANSGGGGGTGVYSFTGSSWGGGIFGARITWSFAESNLSSMFSSAVSGYTQITAQIDPAYRNTVRTAFDIWEAAIGVDFVEVADGGGAQVRVGERAIDGKSGVLATAHWWQSSGTNTHAVITFDSLDTFTTTAYLNTAIHEVGHVLGLGHSSSPDEVMYSFANGMTSLGLYDRLGGELLYGASSNRPPLLSEGGDSRLQPMDLASPNFNITDRITNFEWRDTYRFIANTNGTMTVNLTGLTADLDFYVYSSSGSTITWGARFGTASESASFQAYAGEAYTISVSPFLSSVSPYTLSGSLAASGVTSGPQLPVNTRSAVAATPPTTTPATPITPTNTTPTTPGGDAGDTIAVATAVTIPNISVTQTVGGSDYADFFSFTITGPATISTQLTKLGGNADLTVYASTGAVLGRSEAADTQNESVEITVDSPGSYFIGVSGTNAASPISYTLTGSVTVTAPPTSPSSSVFRFYNTQGGFHFFTNSVTERDTIQQTMPHMRFEGTGFSAPTGAVGTMDVFRFFNTQTGSHFFTASTAERDFIRATNPALSYEGTAYRAFAGDFGPQEELYRFFNTQTGVHFFTATEAERDAVISGLPHMRYEGIAFYILA
ncbi:MAG: matrixin family metalloprotease [Alphaproteobacteria bacterium]|nr:matrixin family metalloprotease [Alphaproteobacteria bacterium]